MTTTQVSKFCATCIGLAIAYIYIYIYIYIYYMGWPDINKYIYTPYMTVYLVTFLPELLYIHRILYIPIRFWPTLSI